MLRPIEVSRSSTLGVIEVVRRDAGSLDAWLGTAAAAMRGIFPASPLVGSMLVHREPTSFRCEHVAPDDGPISLASIARHGWSVAPPHLLDDVRRRGDVVVPASSMAARFPGQAPVLFESFLAVVGGADFMGLLAHAGPHTLCIWALHDRLVRVAGRDRLLLTQLSLHFEAALTLYTQPRSVVAVLRPDGRVLHAEGAGELRSTRDVLSAHIAQVELQRGVRRRDDDAIDGWTALCEGRFALLERESGGRREYVVLESGPHAFERRALDATEARALELSAKGQPNKTVAYALGISAAGVSRALTSAAHKLGLSTGAELVRLAAGVVGPSSLAQVSLTPVEREIVEMLKLGWSNATIGKARGRSERTVANQIAALLRKTGAASRRALSGL